MSQTGPGGEGRRDDAPVRQDRTIGPVRTIDSSPDGARRFRVTSLVAGTFLCALALLLVSAGGYALWKDRVDRDGQGFVSIGTEKLRTDQYAIVGDLRGDGPGWLYGSSVLGDARVRATSPDGQPLFIAIARKEDVAGYLRGVGYATIESFEVRPDTTHPGAAPSGPPSAESFWAASTQGAGRQTLRWTPRSGEWSVVFMNTDASSGVEVQGDASAKLPALPWLAGGFLVIGGAAGLVGARALVRGTRRPGSM